MHNGDNDNGHHRFGYHLFSFPCMLSSVYLWIHTCVGVRVRIFDCGRNKDSGYGFIGGFKFIK